MSIYRPKFISTWYDTDYSSEPKKYENVNSKKYNTKCIIVPHAGYKYTNIVLSETYSKVKWENIDRIIILCTLHQDHSKIYLPIFKKVVYPKHSIDIDIDVVNLLNDTGMFTIDNDIFNTEHSFELQLPYILSYANSSCKIIPLLVGSFPDLNRVSIELLKYSTKNTLFIVSSDFTHYGKRYGYTPFDTQLNSYTLAEKILNKDMNDACQIIKNNVGHFTYNELSICGVNALILWLHYNNKRYHGSVVSYDTSDIENDTSVSYIGMIFCTEPISSNISKIKLYKKLKITIDENITTNTKINIMELCQNKISLIPRATLMASKHFDNIFLYPQSIQNGVFVTMEDNDQLQGCLGLFYDNAQEKNLYRLIVQYTFKTIYEDYRFDDNILRHQKNYKYLYVSTRLNFKVTLLEQQFEVDYHDFWSTYLPCKHGIILKFGSSSATFLPDVMLKQHWLPNCDTITEDKKKYFEAETFNALMEKMGKHGNWKTGIIYLYVGNEYDESKDVLDNYHKYMKYKTKLLSLQSKIEV